MALLRKALKRQTLLIGILLASLLSGCVTTEKGGLGNKADTDRALDYSLQLARTYIRDGNWDAAKRHLKKAKQLDEDSAEVHEALALVFQNTGELERAGVHYQNAIRLDENNSRVRNNYAAFLYQQSDYEAAAKQLEKVVQDTLYERRTIAFMSLGRCYARMQKYDQAIKAYKRSYLMNRRNMAVQLELAEAYYESSQFAESQQFYDGFRKGVRQQPARALWLGVRLADKFDNKDAFSSYSLALKNLYPNSKEYLAYKQAFANE
jgi:type IV pilus assembly protein PilF